MNEYFLIIGKWGLAISVFFLFYRFLLSRDTLFVRNRFFLLAGVVLSFILPFITIPFIITQVSPSAETFVYLNNTSVNIKNNVGVDTGFFSNWPYWVLCLYGTGVLLFLVKTIIAYAKVGSIIISSRRSVIGDMQLAVTSQKVSAFSFLHWLVVSEETQQHPSFEKLVQHEMVHSRQYHSVDLFIAEILVFLQWFNPFAWMLRKAMVENLEYLVDREVLAMGVNAREYQYSLLNFSMVGLTPAVASNFNIHLLKKRIVMMNTNTTSQANRFSNLMIPVCLILVMAVTVSFKKHVNTLPAKDGLTPVSIIPGKTLPKTAVSAPMENLPVRNVKKVKSQLSITNQAVGDKAGEDLFLGYVMFNIIYPKEAAENNLDGTVKVSVTFKKNTVVIENSENANTDNTKELKEVVVIAYGPEGIKIRQAEEGNKAQTEILKAEVIRVVNSFTEIPKDLVGKTYILPVKFLLMPPKGDNKEIAVTGYGGSGQNKRINSQVTIIEEADEISSNKEPFYILNNEKFISKEEMQKINPETIQSIDILKAKKMEHKTLGTINGSVIIINLKK